MSNNHVDTIEFIKKIDCSFPYHDIEKSRELSVEALSISPEAVFSIYLELARPGGSVRISTKRRLVILEYLQERFVHPLSGLASWLTRKMICGSWPDPRKTNALKVEFWDL